MSNFDGILGLLDVTSSSWFVVMISARIKSGSCESERERLRFVSPESDSDPDSEAASTLVAGDSARGRFPRVVDLLLVAGLLCFALGAVVDIEVFVLGCFAFPLGFGAELDGPAVVVRLGGLKGRRGRFGAGLGSPGILII